MNLPRCSLLAVAAAICSSLLYLPASAQEPSVLTVPRLAQFDSLDPQREFDQYSEQALRQLYSTLLTYSYLERPYKLEPDLLESMPALAADKVTYTFRLRKGVRFVDNPCFAGGKGRELTADDVIYTIRRYADANVNNRSFFAMEGAVVGLDAYRAATAKAGPTADLSKTDVAGLRKIDKYTFTIRLTHENPLFLYSLTMAPTAIVPVEAVQMYKDKLSVVAVGSGPFMATAPLDRNGTLHLVRNPTYYRVYPSVGAPGDAEKGLLKDAGKKLPLVDVLDMPLIEEMQPAALKFLRGELDRRELDRANFTKLVLRAPDGSLKLAAPYASQFDLRSSPGGNTVYITLNMRDPVLGKNKALRQALAAAIDPAAIINVLWNGRGIALQSLVPVDLAGSETDTAALARKRDLAAARMLLADAGYPDGKGLPPLTMTFPTADADTRNEFDMVRAQFAAIGVQLIGTFDDVPAFTKSMDAGNFQMAYYSWYADYPDAEDFYQVLYGKNVAPGPNSGNFINAAYDKGYEASRYMVNGPRRYEIFKSLNAIIRDETPVIVARESLRVDTVQKWVGNYKRNIFTTEMQFLSVDMAMKKKGVQ
jgi:oligopeptide transport system substrate-binding protein